MTLNECEPGILVRERYGSATGHIVRVKPSGLIAVFWTGRDTDGRLNSSRGGWDALPSNIERFERRSRKKAGCS